MAVDFLTGFEHGFASVNGGGLFDSVSTTFVDTTSPRTGTYCGLCSAVGTSSFARKNHTGRNHLVVRGYVRMYVLPGAGTIGQLHSTLIGGAFGQIEIESDGVLYAAYRDATQVLQGTRATGPALSVDGQYHLIEAHYDMSASPNVIHWRVDGSAQTDASFTNAARTCTNSNWGQVNTPATYTFRMDDWIQGTVAADYPLGAGKIIWLLAGSDGTHSFTANDFSTGDAGTLRAPSYTDFYLMANKAAPWSQARSTTLNICQRVIRTTGYVEIATATTPETDTANAVRVLVGLSSSGTQANTAGCIARNSAGFAGVIFGDLPVAQGGNGGALADVSDTNNLWKAVVATKPGAGWTPTEVNAIRVRFGGSNDITPLPTIQYIALEIDYPEAAGPVEYTDSATVTVDLQASGVEVFEAVDSATVVLDLQPSGVDVYEPPGVVVQMAQYMEPRVYTQARAASLRGRRW